MWDILRLRLEWELGGLLMAFLVLVGMFVVFAIVFALMLAIVAAVMTFKQRYLGWEWKWDPLRQTTALVSPRNPRHSKYCRK